ncbi:hypothetical protein [Endozoicomonas sp. 8E]|uniref:hypothetical protein n=1 Tax=Endozoicomonas sp. 8E TaxID=3035692 RepID=UPI00293927DB|nr:hypothetical protein [Endozoicomonas sp. 8E]WOG26481.1 hypothetical protein P6910_18300 [Endozoicomonas sp. 8E]
MREENKAINDIPDFSIAADERPGRRKAAATGGTPPVNKAGTGRTPSGKSGNGLAWLVLVMIVVLGAGGVWQFKLIQKELADTRQALKATQEKLSTVTGEITATGENLDQSGSALRSELEVVNSEIRKLWDVSNKRNRQWILINKDNVAKALKEADKAGKTADKASGQLSALQKRIREMDQLMKAISTEQLAAQSMMTDSLAKFDKQVAEMKKLVADQKKLQAELTRKVEDQQQAVKAVDSFRVQVNRKLQQLEDTVRELTQPPREGLGLE